MIFAGTFRQFLGYQLQLSNGFHGDASNVQKPIGLIYIIKRCYVGLSQNSFRIFSLATGYICPLIILLFFSRKPSLSLYWQTEAVPIFVFMTAVTSYFMFSIPKWNYPAFALLLLTAFPSYMFPHTHDILAAVFFILCGRLIAIDNRFRWLALVYLFGVLIAFKNILYGEIIGIYAICTFHALTFYKVQKIFKEKQEISKKMVG
jgi:hypothetical protein